MPQCPVTLQAQRYITQLKAQVNSLEGEVEEQRKQKQKALVDNEQLRDELERLQRAKQDSDRSQRLCAEAESRCPGVSWGVLWCPGVPRGHGLPWLWSLRVSHPCRESQRHRDPLHEAEGEAQRAHQHPRRAPEEGKAAAPAGRDTEGSVPELNPSLLGLGYPGQS